MKNKNGVKALDVASQKGHSDVAELLLENSAETDAESPESGFKQNRDFEEFQQEYRK